MKKAADILIIEDECLVALDIRRCLEQYGHRVIGSVSSAEEALEIVAKQQPDLVLMDIQLKGKMDGVEAAAVISDQFDLPVIYLTANADERTIERAQITEPYAYLVKPFKDVELHAAVQTCIYRHGLKKKIKQNRTAISSSSSANLATASAPAIFKIMRNFELFSKLEDEELSCLANNCEFQSYREGSVICVDGEEDFPAFVVVSGRVSLVKTSAEGKELIVELISVGDLFSLIAAVERSPVPVKIKAQIATKVISIPKKSFLLLLDRHPEMYGAFLSYVNQRLRDSYNFSRALAHDQVLTRIAFALLKLCPNEKEDRQGYMIEITRQEIAELTGAVLETVVRTMKKLKTEGIVDLKRSKCVEVINKSALEKLISTL